MNCCTYDRCIAQLRVSPLEYSELLGSPVLDDHLASDPAMRMLVRRRPGLRVPGQVCGAEAVVRAVLGQQVTLTAARRLTDDVSIGLLATVFSEEAVQAVMRGAQDQLRAFLFVEIDAGAVVIGQAEDIFGVRISAPGELLEPPDAFFTAFLAA